MLALQKTVLQLNLSLQRPDLASFIVSSFLLRRVAAEETNEPILVRLGPLLLRLVVPGARTIRVAVRFRIVRRVFLLLLLFLELGSLLAVGSLLLGGLLCRQLLLNGDPLGCRFFFFSCCQQSLGLLYRPFQKNTTLLVGIFLPKLGHRLLHIVVPGEKRLYRCQPGQEVHLFDG